MSDRVAVVPFGFGLGDTVNMRPLLAAIVRARPGCHISALCLSEYSSLLPAGVEAQTSIRGVPLWQRPSRESLTARTFGMVSARTSAPITRRVVKGRWPQRISLTLRNGGFDEVINLLDVFSSLDLDNRWTPGPWNPTREHVIDVMATFLGTGGTSLPPEHRKPTLPRPPGRVNSFSTIVLNPNSGSSLKEAPIDLWIDVATALVVAGCAPLVLKGRDGDTAAHLCRRVPQVRLIETPGVRTLMRLLASSRLVISPDTGVLHVAAALGVPYIGLFGSTNPEFFGPYGASSSDILLSTAQHAAICRGCWTAQLLSRARCAMKYEPNCLSLLHAADVVARIEEKLGINL